MNQYSEKFKTYIDRIVNQTPDSAPETLRFFIRQFYDKMPLMDLEGIDAATAFTIAQSGYDFLQNRTLKEPKISIIQEKQTEDRRVEKATIEILGDDMPFLVDSIAAELARHELTVYSLIHPVLRVKRDASGKLLQVKERGDSAAQPEEESGVITESYMHITISPLPEEIPQKTLLEDLRRILRTVHITVADWRAILNKIPGTLDIVSNAPASFRKEDIEEVKDFFRWLHNNNFVFLGYLEYDFPEGKEEAFRLSPDSELGLFRMEDCHLKPQGLKGLPQEVVHFARNPQLVEITKSNLKSPVHRPTHMDYVSVKRFDENGKVVGENRFLGLFTSRVYYQSADDIPIIRRKIARTLERANFDPVSHNGKALKAIMEFFPRDELFQISEEDLFTTSMGILSLDARPDVRLFVRQDVFERFVSCLLYVPRERFSTYLRERIQEIIENAYDGKITAHYTQVTDSPLARLHLIVKTTPGHVPAVDIPQVERTISKVTNLWSDSLLEALIAHHGARKGEQLFRVYRNAFPSNYISHYSTEGAVFDIQKIEEATASHYLALDLFRKTHDAEGIIRLKLYNPKDQVPLSDILPMLENMGFRVLDETPYLITPKGDNLHPVWIRDLRLTSPGSASIDMEALKPRFEAAMARVWKNAVENDGFNALVLKAGLHWRDAVLLRAYSKYLKQTGLSYNQDFIIHALAANPHICRKLVELFYARFEPQQQEGSTKRQTEIVKNIDTLLMTVSNLAEDRVIRLFINVIDSTLRTNFFQLSAEGSEKDYISFKIDSQKVAELPLPRPFREIFVYSIRTEGIHLRGGKVARGGLRWSDRHEDFRTEILGLMKAQMVKNTIIVPVGSKGGFVVKQPPIEGGREAMMQEGIACYKTFLRGLLDVTDNIINGTITPPVSVVRHDEDDPYLVVAADKGTATFSDIANGISAEYGFWLGDAFASGGSVGYDHKKMAITARGGWVSVTRHFREMGKEISQEDFTVTGIGDMSGDVFGNGMLLSRHIRLVAAFNHMHIFLDPNPDAETTYKERERLFNLPRSTWADYDAKLISKGGGIYARSEKTIPITPEVREVLDLPADMTALAPDALVKAILRAPVELLWNGGIGTYIKAKTESHEEVGDRSNNAVRVNGEELRCSIIGEGGNLGVTQRGRIEFARKGGRINTDALDNSAGVSCSDHEVNIKIALAAATESRKITLEERDALLLEMTEEVAALVLRDNELQNQALSNAEAQGYHILESRARLIRTMERKGLLNREIEFLPTDEEIADRRVKKLGFTRPELAVILAYSKLALYQEILDSSLPDAPYFKKSLIEYFPVAMRQKFEEEIVNHPLRREIIATVITNSMINRVGSAFFYAMAEDYGVHTCDVVRAFIVTRDAFSLRSLWKSIEGLTGSVTAAVQADMFVEINHFVSRVTGWFLRNYPQPIDISQAMLNFEPGVREFMALSHAIGSEVIRQAAERKYDRFVGVDVPKDIATRIADLEALSSACDVVRVALNTSLPVKEVGHIYFELGQQLQLGWLRIAAEKMPVDSHWDRIAITSIVNDLFDQQRRLTQNVITGMEEQDDAKVAVQKWQERNRKHLARLEHFLHDLKTVEILDFPMLVVGMRNVEAISAAEIATPATKADNNTATSALRRAHG